MKTWHNITIQIVPNTYFTLLDLILGPIISLELLVGFGNLLLGGKPVLQGKRGATEEVEGILMGRIQLLLGEGPRQANRVGLRADTWESLGMYRGLQKRGLIIDLRSGLGT